MPEKRTLQRARRDARQGKAPSTQAGEFIREEIDDIRKGKHGARSAKQAIAIGLSKARRAGVDLPNPKKGSVSAQTRRKAQRDSAVGHGAAPKRAPSARRSAASERALRREPRSSVSHAALSKQARSAATRRTRSERSASARRAARTRKGESHAAV
jgi:hypothetical protein